MSTRPAHRQQRRATIPAKLDMVFAYKTICLVPGLSAAERRVAAALIDHCNKKTGQCDPSIDRIARLLDIDARTVKRATKSLCTTNSIRPALFVKSSHGGSYHRAFYHPQWHVFREFVATWDADMKVKQEYELDSKVTETPPFGWQECPLDGDENVPQTLLINSSNKPLEAENKKSSNHVEEPKLQQRYRQAEISRGFGKGKGMKIRQSPPRSAVVKNKAQERIDNDLRQLGEEAYAFAIETITPEQFEAATEKECTKTGAGILFLMVILQIIDQHNMAELDA